MPWLPGGAALGVPPCQHAPLPPRHQVYADEFLVAKLRPHQHEGLQFVFSCLTGVRQPGFFGGVLCDGMGLGEWGRGGGGGCAGTLFCMADDD